MILTYLMLVVALCLSAIAAFYSIVGLTAIFAAAVVPIVVMGTVLEAAKLVVTVWLHEYWSQVKLSMKLYLVPAVFILMVITSMGIFGFLSKAHLDQTVPTGDVQAQVALIDEKINNERDTIANARTLLGQLDKAVTDIGSAPDREVNGRVISSAERALQVRRQQARDRAALTKTIEDSQARIVKLQEEKAPFAKDLRKIEAEVGPIKYIAALIYGDNPDANLLEKAVRWVIIILVIVFDPLAIMMLLAFTESLRWEKHNKSLEPVTGSDPVQPVNDAVQKTKVWAEDLWQRFRKPKNGTVPDDATVTKDLDGHPSGNNLVDEPVAQVVERPTDIPNPEIKYLGDADDEDPSEKPLPPATPELVVQEEDEEEDEQVKAAQRRWKVENPDKTLKEQRRLLAQGMITHLPWEDYMVEGIDSKFGFGSEFPADAAKGDLFCRTDALPTTLFKFNGTKWIEIDKTLTDLYSYDDSYIDYLISKISSGEYDPELLTTAERSQIEQRLRKDLA